jgi:Spy/CpxP family protein refolding chaperone
MLVGLVSAGMAMADGKGCHHGGGEGVEQEGYGHKGGKKGGMMIRHMTKALDLTDAQKSAIKDIMKVQRNAESDARHAIAAQLLELKQLESGSDAYIAKAKAIGTLQGQAMGQRLIEQANIETQITDVLTPEQVEQYQQMRNEMSDKRAEHMEKRGKKSDHSN